MKRSVLTRGVFALTVLAAAVCAVGFNARAADAQSPLAGINAPARGIVGVPIQVSAVLPSGSGTIRFIHWDFSDGATDIAFALPKTFTRSGTFRINATAYTYEGRVFTASTTIAIDEPVPAPRAVVVQIPTYFPVFTSLLSTGCPYGATIVNGVSYCASVSGSACPYGAIVVNGIVTCGGSTLATSTLLQRVGAFNPACYQLWIQTGVLPVCALAYR